MLDVAAVLTSAFNPIVGQAVGNVGEDRKIRWLQYKKPNKNLSVLLRRIARQGVSFGFLFTAKIYSEDKEPFKLATKGRCSEPVRKESGKEFLHNFIFKN